VAAKHPVDLCRQLVGRDLRHPCEELPGRGLRENVDALDACTHRSEHLEIARRVEDTPQRPGHVKRRRGGIRPHVVDDQKAAAVGERSPQRRGPLGRRANLGLLLAEAPEQVDLRSHQFGVLAQGHPEQPIGEVVGHAGIAGQGGGEDALADPSLAVQTQRLGIARDAHEAGVTLEQGGPQCAQFRPFHVGGGRRWHAMEAPRPGGVGEVLHGLERLGGGSDSCLDTGGREEVADAPADADDRALIVAAAAERPVTFGVVGPLHPLEDGEFLPQAGMDQHADQADPSFNERGELDLPDEARGEELRAHEEQREGRLADGTVDRASPLATDLDVLVRPDLQPLVVHERLQHDQEPPQPLRRVLMAVADKDEPASAIPCRRGHRSSWSLPMPSSTPVRVYPLPSECRRLRNGRRRLDRRSAPLGAVRCWRTRRSRRRRHRRRGCRGRRGRGRTGGWSAGRDGRRRPGRGGGGRRRRGRR
jgi:hypothetical protein